MRHALIAAAFAAVLTPAAALAAPLKVVELFQSQGCSSCPPAIANVNRLADRQDLLTLMFAVTYWDRLGWKDTFARPEYTERQYAYGRVFGDGAYTPEVVIDGRHDLVGTDTRQLESAIAKALPDRDAPAIAPQGAGVSVGAAPSSLLPQGWRGADVWLVRYDPRIQNVPIGAGENSGLTIAHRNIVRALVKLGDWNGAAKTYAVPAGDPAWRSAILVQEKNGGAILATLKL